MPRPMLFGYEWYNTGHIHQLSIKDFNLWIACFDDITYSVLKKLNLKNVILISREDFEDEELLRTLTPPGWGIGLI